MTAPTRSAGTCARSMARPATRDGGWISRGRLTWVSLCVIPGGDGVDRDAELADLARSARVKPITPAFEVV